MSGGEADGALARPSIASLDERGLHALTVRVGEVLEHELALEATDLALPFDALVNLAAVTERLERDDLMIATLGKGEDHRVPRPLVGTSDSIARADSGSGDRSDRDRSGRSDMTRVFCSDGVASTG